MGKNNRRKGAERPGEEYLHLPPHPSFTPTASSIVDTHTHLMSTFSEYAVKYPALNYPTVHDFIRGMYCSDTPAPISQMAGWDRFLSVEAVINSPLG